VTILTHEFVGELAALDEPVVAEVADVGLAVGVFAGVVLPVELLVSVSVGPALLFVSVRLALPSLDCESSAGSEPRALTTACASLFMGYCSCEGGVELLCLVKNQYLIIKRTIRHTKSPQFTPIWTRVSAESRALHVSKKYLVNELVVDVIRSGSSTIGQTHSGPRELSEHDGMPGVLVMQSIAHSRLNYHISIRFFEERNDHTRQEETTRGITPGRRLSRPSAD
jgi:hypothetical protein